MLTITNLHDKRTVFDIHGELISIPAKIWRSSVSINGTKHFKTKEEQFCLIFL